MALLIAHSALTLSAYLSLFRTIWLVWQTAPAILLLNWKLVNCMNWTVVGILCTVECLASIVGNQSVILLLLKTKTRPVKTEYKLHDQILTAVESAKYLGVNISSNLSWNTHVDTTAKKATQTLNFFRRNFSCCPISIREQCYKTWWDLGLSMHRHCGTTRPSATSPRSKQCSAVPRGLHVGLQAYVECHSHATEAPVGLPSAASSSQQSPNAVPSPIRSSSHSCFSPSTASCCPHQRVRNQI